MKFLNWIKLLKCLCSVGFDLSSALQHTTKPRVRQVGEDNNNNNNNNNYGCVSCTQRGLDVLSTGHLVRSSAG